MTTQLNGNSVLVIGATGNIGFGVSLGFRRAGFTVYGVLRDSKKEKLLLAHEITPVLVTNAHDIPSYEKYIKAASVIVDATSTFTEPNPALFPKTLLKAVEEIAKHADPLLGKKVFIYTSGIMVYAHSEQIRDETWPVAEHEYSKWRRDVEEAVIQSTSTHGIVIRPGWVFGGEGGHTSNINKNPGAKLVFKGVHKDRRYSWIHVDDLATSYVAAALRAPLVRGEIFNIVNGYDNPAWAELSHKGAVLNGFTGTVEWVNPENWVDILLDSTVVLSPEKAIRLLDWHPRIFGFLDNLEFYSQTVVAKKSFSL